MTRWDMSARSTGCAKGPILRPTLSPCERPGLCWIRYHTAFRLCAAYCVLTHLADSFLAEPALVPSHYAVNVQKVECWNDLLDLEKPVKWYVLPGWRDPFFGNRCGTLVVPRSFRSVLHRFVCWIPIQWVPRVSNQPSYGACHCLLVFLGIH